MTVEKAKKLGLNFQKARKVAFMSAKTLEEALGIAWGSSKSEKYYYHYTSLSKLMANICGEGWYFRRSTDARFNDQQEVLKFGNEKIAKETYQLSLGKGCRESAALWGLYANNDPWAIKVLIKASAVEMWVDELKTQYPKAEFRDVIYASIPFRREGQTNVKNRGKSIVWDGVTCDFCGNKTIKENLPSLLKKDEYTGWFKDVEWAHEVEARICIRSPGDARQQKDSLIVKYPPEMVDSMSFTFSPWANPDQKKKVKKCLLCAMKKNTEKLKNPGRKWSSRYFRPSTLEGALNFSTGVAFAPPGCPVCMYERSK